MNIYLAKFREVHNFLIDDADYIIVAKDFETAHALAKAISLKIQIKLASLIPIDTDIEQEICVNSHYS